MLAYLCYFNGEFGIILKRSAFPDGIFRIRKYHEDFFKNKFAFRIEFFDTYYIANYTFLFYRIEVNPWNILPILKP